MSILDFLFLVICACFDDPTSGLGLEYVRTKTGSELVDDPDPEEFNGPRSEELPFKRRNAARWARFGSRGLGEE